MVRTPQFSVERDIRHERAGSAYIYVHFAGFSINKNNSFTAVAFGLMGKSSHDLFTMSTI